MIYTAEKASSTNLLSLDEQGLALASPIGSPALVILRDISIAKLRLIWEDFKAELRRTIRDVLGKTPGEFADWHLYNDKYRFHESTVTASSCVAFKRPAAGTAKLSYMRQPAIVEALKNLNLVPLTDAHGNQRKNMVRGEGGVPTFCQNLSLAQQRSILAEIFAADQSTLDEILVIGQTTLVNTEAVNVMLESATDVDCALQWLAEALWRFDTEQMTQVAGGRGAGRHYAAPWFCAYLAREGYVLLPRLKDSENLVPRLFTPLLWTFFVQHPARELAGHIIRHIGDAAWQYSYSAFRDLLLNTNFFRGDLTTLKLDLFLRLKREYTASEKVADRVCSAGLRSHGLNRLFEAYINFHGKTWEDIGPDARYFGGGKKLASDRGREAFAWVEDPKGHKLALYREIIGEPPREFSQVIQDWARDLRNILAAFGVQDPEQKIRSLNFWLMYLVKLGNEAPKTWWDIDRETHINDAGQSTNLTFVKFVKGLDLVNRQKVISDLQKAWLLAAARDGVASKLTCPIDFKLDHVGWGSEAGSFGRTRRKSVPQQIHRIILDEHRRDKFAFARSLAITDGPRQGTKIHWRRIVDPISNQRVAIFWPGVPIILDVILAMGTRFSSARWLDSGEGDEFLVDPDTLELAENPLPSRTKKRAAGFLQVHQIGLRETEKVLGMHLAVNKTGPYSVPWVDLETARSFHKMRAWQIAYNPRRLPVKSSSSDVQIQYAGEGKIPEVYPVFRDPDSRISHPPSAQTIYAYWEALLRHCEPIAEKQLGYFEPLILDGKPRWDLHSLRVTTVSTLLEAGIEPWIVAELVGHASVMMTWHYKDVDPRKTHLALQQAYERRRDQTLEALADLQAACSGTDEEFQARLEEILGGLVVFREDNSGVQLLRPSLAEGVAPEVFAHGICPGGDCSAGGREYKNAPQSVFRPRACSRCRFRLTGPVFLAGLVHRMNSLMVEIKASMEKEGRLNLEVEQLEERGAAAGKLLRTRGLITRERELRDELWAEWCAELTTIRKAEGVQDSAGKGGGQSLAASADLSDVHVQWNTVHQLALFHSVIQEGDLILGASLEVPANLRERRDSILLEVARNNDLAAFFYKLAPERRKRALDRFGDLLLDHVSDSDNIQRLIDGEMSVSALPTLDVHLQELVAAETPFGIAPSPSRIEVETL